MLKLCCHAKINLFLKVLGKRDDGFHNLESLFAFVDLCDVLQVEKNEKFTLKIDGEFADLVDIENNLFTKILDFFVQEFAVEKKLLIRVTKNIPVGAGLGGGSSNAASFIKILNEIFDLNLNNKVLQEIGLRFGSDIPFFFEDFASIIKGRGEIIEKYPYFKPIKILLINPKIAIPTKTIFENFNDKFSSEISSDILQKMPIFDLLNLPNDLEKVASKTLPLIREIMDDLKFIGADFFKMSGSGSSCFGVFLDEKKLDFALKFFIKKFPHFFIKKSQIMHHI